MTERQEEPKYDPSWLLSIQIRANKIFEEAAVVYSTDPGKADCIRAAMTECLKAIKDCLGETGEEEGTGPVWGPGCPQGFHKEGGRCVPDY